MGLLGCVVWLWISWLQAHCYSVWRGHVLLLLPQAVSGNRSGICGTLCWSNPCQCVPQRCSSAEAGFGGDILQSLVVAVTDILLLLCLLYSFGLPPLMLSFVGVHLFLFIFFLRSQCLSVSPARELCATLLFPPEPQCNIHDTVEWSQRHAGDTQKDLEKLLLSL